MMLKIKRIALMLIVFALFITLCSVISVNTEAKVRINKQRLSMIISEQYILKLKGFKKKITWKSSRPTIAKVDKKGAVTALSKGRVVITAKANKKKYKCIIVVKEKESQTSPYVPTECTPDPNATDEPCVSVPQVQSFAVFHNYYISDKGKDFIEISDDTGKSIYLSRDYSIKIVCDGKINVKDGDMGLRVNFIEGEEMKYSNVKIGDIVDVVYDYWRYSPLDNQVLSCVGINIHGE